MIGLDLARRNVVGDRVAEDVLRRPIGRNTPSGCANDQRELDLVVEALGERRVPANVVLVADKRRRWLGEDLQVLRCDADGG